MAWRVNRNSSNRRTNDLGDVSASNTVVDVTSDSALVVRKEGNSGDIFVVDSKANHVYVYGDLTVSGTQTNANPVVSVTTDTFMHIASGNSGDTVDFGLYGEAKISGTTRYYGVFRDHTDSIFKIGYTLTQPATTFSGLTLSDFQAANIYGVLATSVQPNITTIGNYSGILKAANGFLSTTATTTDLIEGTNLYFTNARWDTRLAAKTTADLAEGVNLYFTTARARGVLSATGTGLSYNSSTGVINFDQTALTLTTANYVVSKGFVSNADTSSSVGGRLSLAYYNVTGLTGGGSINQVWELSVDSSNNLVISRNNSGVVIALTCSTSGVVRLPNLTGSQFVKTDASSNLVTVSNISTSDIASFASGVQSAVNNTSLSLIAVTTSATSLFGNCNVGAITGDNTYAGIKHSSVGSYALLSASNGDVYLNCGSSGNLYFRENNTNVFYWNSNALRVANGASLVFYSAATTDYFSNIYQNTNEMRFNSDGDLTYRQGLSSGLRTGSGFITFYTGKGTANGGAGVTSEKMRIDADGRICMGTSSPGTYDFVSIAGNKAYSIRLNGAIGTSVDGSSLAASIYDTNQFTAPVGGAGILRAVYLTPAYNVATGAASFSVGYISPTINVGAGISGVLSVYSGLYISTISPTVGSGGTLALTTAYGIYVDNVATSSGGVSGYTNSVKYGLYVVGQSGASSVNITAYFGGNVQIAGNSNLEFGAGLTKEANAGKIGYGLLTSGVLDIVGGGTTSSNRSVKIWAESGAVFTGSVSGSGFTTAVTNSFIGKKYISQAVDATIGGQIVLGYGGNTSADGTNSLSQWVISVSANVLQFVSATSTALTIDDVSSVVIYRDLSLRSTNLYLKTSSTLHGIVYDSGIDGVKIYGNLGGKLVTVTDSTTRLSWSTSGVSVTGVLSASGFIIGQNVVSQSTSATEGGQIVLGYGGNSNVTSESASTWNIDVAVGGVTTTNDFRIFRKTALNAAATWLTITEAGTYTFNTALSGYAKFTAGVLSASSTILYSDISGLSGGTGVTYSGGVISIGQSVATSASVTFAGITVGVLSGVLKATSGVVSGSATTTDLIEGTNLYFTNARWDTRLATKTTADLAEGVNLYFTTVRARGVLSAGTGVSYNSTTGVISIGQDVSVGASVTFGVVAVSSLAVSAQITASDYTAVKNYLICNSLSATEGGQLVLTYANKTGVIGEAAGTWNLDVSDSSVANQFRIFRKNAANSPLNTLVINEDSTIIMPYYTGASYLKTDGSGLISCSSAVFSSDVRGLFSGGTGVTYTGGSGVIAIGQSVATSASPSFAGLTLNNSSVGPQILATFANGDSGVTTSEARIVFSEGGNWYQGISGKYNSAATKLVFSCGQTVNTWNAVGAFWYNSGLSIGTTSNGVLPPTNGLLVQGNLVVGSSTSGLVYSGENLQIVGSMVIGATTAPTTGLLRFVSNSSVNYIESGLTSVSGSSAPLVFTSMNSSVEWARFSSAGLFSVGSSVATSMVNIVLASDNAGGNGVYTGNEVAKHGLQISTGQTISSDQILYMGADSYNGCCYIQSVLYGAAVSNLLLNGRGGNVGIGMMPSGFKLDVSGDVRFSGNLTVAGLTASQYVKTNGSKVLVSSASIPYSDISGLSGGVGVTYSGGVISIGQSVATSASPTFANLVVGNIIADSTFAGFSYSGLNTGLNYCILQQNNGATYINCSNSRSVSIRSNNVDMAVFTQSAISLAVPLTNLVVTNYAICNSFVVRAETLTEGGQINLCYGGNYTATSEGSSMWVLDVSDSVSSHQLRLFRKDGSNSALTALTFTEAGVLQLPQLTGSYLKADGSGVVSCSSATFTSDVRAQFSQSTGILISSGAISVDAANPPAYTADLLTTGKFQSTNVSGFKEPFKLYGAGGICYIEQTLNSATVSEIRINPKSTSDLSLVSLFRDVNTSGNASLTLYKANNTTTVNHKLYANNTLDSYLCADNGNVAIGSTSAGGYKLQVTGNVNVTGSISAANLSSGTYAVTITNVVSVNGAASSGSIIYSRLGTNMMMSGRLNITTNALGNEFTFDISLPSGTTFADYTSAWGTGAFRDTSTSQAGVAISINSKSGTQRITFSNSGVPFQINIANGSSFTCDFTLLYVV
jgi:hypothetical protein